MDNQVRTVFFHAVIKATGEDLALVELIDSTIAIFRNGAVVEGCSWSAGELERGVDGFTDLKRCINAAKSGSVSPVK